VRDEARLISSDSSRGLSGLAGAFRRPRAG
jgi:hypothetical protein